MLTQMKNKYGKRICIFLFLLLCDGIFGYTGQENIASEEQIDKKAQEALFLLYQEDLYRIDQMREENLIFGENGWACTDDVYREVIGEDRWGQTAMMSPGWPDDKLYNGILIVKKDARGFGMRIVVAEGSKAGSEVWEYGYYESGDVAVVTCSMTGAREGDVPEYQVCGQALYYTQITDSDMDEPLYQSSPNRDWDRCMQKYGQMTYEQGKEYYVADEQIFEVDRENGRMSDVSDRIDAYMVGWLRQCARRVCCRLKVTPEVIACAKELLPGDYTLSSDSEVAVSDVNQDGWDDYVVLAKHTRIDDAGNPYQAQDMWLFISDGTGGYDRKLLERWHSGSIEFMSDNVFRCWRYIGEDVESYQYFSYDSEQNDFFLDRMTQCERGDSYVLFEGRETMGEVLIEDFFRDAWDYASRVREYYNHVVSHENYEIIYRRSINYKNTNTEIEDLVRDEISMLQEVAVKSTDINASDVERLKIVTCVDYITPRVISGHVNWRVYRTDSGNDYYTYVSILLDTEHGERLDITELIKEEELLEICRRAAKDERRRELAKEEKERGIELIQELYEDAGRVTATGQIVTGTDGKYLWIELTAWGLHVSGRDEEGTVDLWLDKENFYNTPLWYYMEPTF